MDRASLWSETRVLLEPLRMVRDRRILYAAPRGEGPVMVLPGYLTADRATAPLRWWLGNRGYHAVGWGLGVNRGGVGSVVPHLFPKLAAFERPVALVGWSWGGVVARAVARAHPECVSRVITLGSPLQGGVRETAYGTRASEEELEHSAREALRRESEPLTVPALSIFTRTDGVVAWSASQDPVPGRTRNLEVRSCHTGLVMSPAVWRAVAEALGGHTPDSEL